MSRVWAEVWTRPGDANFGRVIDDPQVVDGGMHDGLNQVGDGNMDIPDSFTRFDEILLSDPDTPANSVSSLVRYFSEDAPTIPFFEWLPNSLVPTENKDDPDVTVTGLGFKSVLGFARLEPYDWDGTDDFTPAQPDWIWGAQNQLTNPGFEDSPITPKSFHLAITATGGTFTLTDGTDTTSAIAYNAASATIETRIETDLGLFTDVIVVQIGTSPTTHLIEMVNPPFGVNLGINTGSLTGGSGTTSTVEEGGLSSNPWTKAQTLASGVPKDMGSYDQFGVNSTNPRTGTYSLFIDPGTVGDSSNRNLGAQQVVTVTPGAIYQASIWVYPTSASDRFRLGLFGIGEEFIAWNAAAGVTLTINTWNQITLSDILIPEGVEEAILRIQCTNQFPSSPAIFYVDDAEFYGGFAPTTIGDILSEIYDHAIDPALRSTLICWDDGSGTNTPYLTLDFDASLDSNGDAWADTAVTTRLTMRQSYSQIMANLCRNYGVEYRIVPDDVEAGTWLWQVYNPDGMDATPDVAVQGGSSDVRRSVRRFLPTGTDSMVEGLERVTSRDRNTNLMTALGRIEASRLDREAADLAAAIDAASQDVATALTGARSLSYTLVDPQDEPLVDVLIGDTVIVEDPPEVDTETTRLVDVVLSFSPTSTQWETQYGSTAITNPDAAVASAVSGLLSKFEYPDELGGGGVSVGGGAGGAFTVQVAAYDAPDIEKAKADYVCSGVDDLDVWDLAIQEGRQGGQDGLRLLLSSGTFVDTFTANSQTLLNIVLNEGIIIQGQGRFATQLQVNNGGYSNSTILAVGDHCTLRNFGIFGGSGTGEAISMNGYGLIDDMYISTGFDGILLGDSTNTVTDSWLECSAYAVRFTTADQIITNNHIFGGTGIFGATGFGPAYIANNTISITSGNCIEGSGNAWKIDNNFLELGTWGIVIATGEAHWTITNNHFRQNTGISYGAGVGHVIANNTFEDGQIVGTDAEYCIIALNRIEASAVDTFSATIGFNGDPTFCSVIGNTMTVSTHGVRIAGSGTASDNAISGNIIENADTGILLDGVENTRVQNNTVKWCGEHGISLDDSNLNEVSGNLIYQPGQTTTNTYDGIILAGDSDDNDIWSNKIIGAGSAPVPRYGINISASTCDDNSYLGNRTGPSGDYGTGAYIDSGTGTINTWPGAAAPQGDNLL